MPLIKTMAEMVAETAAVTSRVCPRCGCRDTRMLLGTDGRRFRGCRFCFTPRPELVAVTPPKKRAKK